MTITTDTTLLHDPRRQAALLYWQGFSVPQIAAMLQMKRPTVQSWKQRDGWDSVAPISRVEMSLEARLTQLIIKPQKTGGDFKEIDLLGRQIERLARVNRYSQTGNEADLKRSKHHEEIIPFTDAARVAGADAGTVPDLSAERGRQFCRCLGDSGDGYLCGCRWCRGVCH
ncbi:hypothetical protein DFZ77_16105 [Escherichia coli]|nr:hypothetical protein [Escherichia coli]EFD0679029.1 hypothetical protein [Escherichia coli]